MELEKAFKSLELRPFVMKQDSQAPELWYKIEGFDTVCPLDI